jgi:dTDP-4-amino-4,6-dideoxygalactose transaminase
MSARTILPADPRAGYLKRRSEIDEAVHGVLSEGTYVLGKNVAAFEEEFAEYLGSQHCVGVASGTDAVLLALRACGVGPGDHVVTVSHTAVATVAAVELAGAAPVLVDVDPTTYTIDVGHLATVLFGAAGQSVKAIVVVHLYGQPADIDEVCRLGRERGVPVIEDCAQAHGASVGERRVGTFGAAGAFSFYPTKNLGALGDGGAVVTDDPDVAHRLRLLRQYGWSRRYISDVCGTNSRLDELQAAILRVKLRYLERDNERRRSIADRYGRLLAASGVTLPSEAAGTRHVYHQYVIETDGRDELRRVLKGEGIETSILYPVPVHLQPAYRDRVAHGPMDQTVRLASRILSLPMFAELPDEDTDTIAAAVFAWAGRR